MAIPPGKIATYGQVASLAGFPNLTRQVSKALQRKGDALPWHRVVSSMDKNRVKISDKNGERGGLQRELLIREGVSVNPGLTISRASYSWLPPDFVK